ncbi:sensor histidine kinase [Actinomadura sp. 21ATH]|uniref:sensor histidine kinase n=1 Tax=Actinomadura sp. 21ATH TaxID=1735444 RepID=UPI0035C09896
MRASLRPSAGGAAAALLLAGLAAAPFHGPAAVAAGAAWAAAVLAVRPASRLTLWTAGAAVTGSLCASAAFLFFGVAEPVIALGYAEMAALTVMAGGLARWSAFALAAAAGTAVIALVLRLIAASTDVPPVTAAIACAIFSAGPLAAAACGTYLRALDERRRHAIAAARREQRLELARDLHDFVAHDVSAIVAQAQAGQVAGPERAAALFAGVERAGLNALASMDRAIDALSPGRRGDREPPPGLGELPALAERYSAAGPARVRLTLDPVPEVSREAATTAYRVVVEALTNVRRHAPAATTVDVDVRCTPDRALEVVVTDDAGPARPAPRAAGLGLPGLAERVRALGGTFSAGPDDRGWRVRAVLPDRAAER